MRRKIAAELKGKSEAEQIRIIEGYVRDWPPNVRGEYVEMRRHLARRLDKLRTSSRATASSGAPPDDPFAIAKTGHLTAVLVGLPNVGKSYVFHRLGGSPAIIADYPFSTTIPAVHVAPLDNLSVQIVDLPPLAEGAVDGLPYGEKLRSDRRPCGRRVCRAGRVGRRRVTGAGPRRRARLPRRPASSRVDPAQQPGVRASLPRRRGVWRHPERYEGALALRSRLRRRAPTRREGWRIRSHTRQAAGPADGGSGSAVGETRGDRRRPGGHRPRRPRAAADRRPRVGESVRQPGQTVSTDHPLADGDLVELLTR